MGKVGQRVHKELQHQRDKDKLTIVHNGLNTIDEWERMKKLRQLRSKWQHKR